MVRLQVQLTEEQLGTLRKLALAEGVSIAQLIREGVDRRLSSRNATRRVAHLERLRERVAGFRSGISDLGQQHDRYFSEAFETNADDDVH